MNLDPAMVWCPRFPQFVFEFVPRRPLPAEQDKIVARKIPELDPALRGKRMRLGHDAGHAAAKKRTDLEGLVLRRQPDESQISGPCLNHLLDGAVWPRQDLDDGFRMGFEEASQHAG